MKKALITALAFSLPLLVQSQLVGDGSFANPWSGTMAGDGTWSGTKYINGDITVDNEKLTVSPGAIIIFVAEDADLIITGTGSLDASGTNGSRIIITADDDNDGNYGESGERWGHIFFNLPSESNQSKIDYCTIEYGDVHAFSDSRGYGGAIFSNFSNLIISNTILRNNYGDWGGGLFVGASKNPTVRRCRFYSNKSDHAGGGVYCWNYSSSLFENSIFDSNQCLESSVPYYTGGGLAAQTNCSIKIVNCTFANNTSTRTEGQGLLLYNSPNSRVINSIFWGASLKQIYCYGSSTASNFINDAYRGITYSFGTPVNPVILNASNSAADGPNFVAIDGSDWSINYLSPCRDTGVDSYPGITIPATDYAGNSRIFTTDIGAFENQHSRWKTTAGSTDWTTASNWDGGVPTSERDVIIPSGLSTYPVNPLNPGFTIGSGKLMILNPGAQVTLSSLTNNGTLKLESDATNISSLITGSYSGNAATIELYLTGGGARGTYKWHYISIPTSTNVAVTTFTGTTLDLAGYNEQRVSTDVSQGWIGFDGWIYSTPEVDFDYNYDFTELVPARGYEYWDNVDNKYTFTGSLNTSDVPSTVTFKSGGIPAINGFNLIGNPFPSGLDWNYIIANGFPENTSKSLYFTLNNKLASYISGVGVPAGVNGFIPPMQGFMTKTYVSNHTIVLATAARTHSMHARYKGDSPVIPLVRLSLAEESLTDETVVRFDELAKSTLDNDFDAVKMSVSPEELFIYSSLGGVNYVINGQPFPETNVEIPIVINLLTDGTHTITATELQGLDTYNVYLTDNTTGFTANLKTTPVVTFSATAGTIADRFVVKVGNITTGYENQPVSKNTFNIYNGNDLINIQTLSDEWDGITGAVTVLDLSGKIITNLRNAEFTKNSLVQVQAPSSRGLYIVELKSGVKRYVGKVVIR